MTKDLRVYLTEYLNNRITITLRGVTENARPISISGVLREVNSDFLTLSENRKIHSGIRIIPLSNIVYFDIQQNHAPLKKDSIREEGKLDKQITAVQPKEKTPQLFQSTLKPPKWWQKILHQIWSDIYQYHVRIYYFRRIRCLLRILRFRDYLFIVVVIIIIFLLWQVLCKIL